jgi:GNAT superfamily N-acetyltransferase
MSKSPEVTDLTISRVAVESDNVYDDPRFTELARLYAQLLDASWDKTSQPPEGELASVLQMMRECTDTFAIEEQGTVRGVAVVDINDETAWLEVLVVDATRRDLGIGQRAPLLIEEIACLQGATSMLLTPTYRATSFYERAGYVCATDSVTMPTYQKTLRAQ